MAKYRVLAKNISFVESEADHAKILKATKNGTAQPVVQRTSAAAGDVLELPDHVVEGMVVGTHIELVDSYGNKKKASKGRSRL